MKLFLTLQAEGDISYWNRHDKSKVAKIRLLISDILNTPFSGLGKPEPLKHALAGYWSRRIDREHRLVYKVEADKLFIISCRFHYA